MKWIEVWVGILMIAGLGGLLVLAFRVSGLASYAPTRSFAVSAEFENIGDLKPRAPVTIAGVRVGEVERIDLNDKTYKANVKLRIVDKSNIPVDSSASIVTAGLLGANYVSLTPGFEESFLQEGGQITDTHPALQLETMIGQFLFNMKKDTPSSSPAADKA